VRFPHRLWIGLIVMAFLSPVGIVLPRIFGAESAWGEWSADALGKMLGYIPEGLKTYAGFWKAPVAEYSLSGENASFAIRIISCVVSGFLGILLAGLIVYLMTRIWTDREK
jgi:cobalt/nickel transport protein